MTVTFLILGLLLKLVPGHHQLQNRLEQSGGLGQERVNVPFPFDALQEKEQVGGLVEQFGGHVAQAKGGIAKIAGVLGGAVKGLEPLEGV